MSLVYWIGLAMAEPSVVFVGNSYIQSNNLPGLVEGFAQDLVDWEEVETHSLTAGGLTLSDHAQRVNDPNSTWAQTFQEAHDLFVFQDQSQIPGFPQTETYWQDSLDGLMALHELVSVQDAQSMLMLTWGRRDGDAQNPVLYSDFLTMQERLNEGYLAYASIAETATNPIYVAPVGPVFAKIFETDQAIFSSLYNGDGSHPSLVGSTVASLALVSSITGRSTPTEQINLTENVALIVQDAVEQVVLYDAVGTYPMPWLWFQIPDDGQIKSEGIRPLLRIRTDQERDLNVVDGRLWLEAGRLVGTTTVDQHSEFRIVGGSQVGPVNGNIELVEGRLRLTQVTGDVVQTGGEIWLDSAEATIDGHATLTYIELRSDLDEAYLYTEGMNIQQLEVGEGLVWSEGLNNTIHVVRLIEDSEPTTPEYGNTNEESVDESNEKDPMGCATTGRDNHLVGLLLLPLWIIIRRNSP